MGGKPFTLRLWGQCQVAPECLRETFPTKGEAESRAAPIRTQVENEEQAAFSLPAAIRTEAVRAVEKLTPNNATITEAVDHYLQHVLKYRTAPVVTEIIEKLRVDAAAKHRRERTIKDLRHRLTLFAKIDGGSRIAEIAREELKNWLSNPTLAPRSRINYAVRLSQLWNYAIANGWAENNLVASIPRPDTEDSDPEIFTVEQTAGLLEHAEKHDLLGYIVLGLFAGLRSAEINRLDWKDVKLAERNIIIGTAVAKKRSRRVVEINDTLAAWLPLCVKAKGPVVPLDSNRTLYARLAKLATATGLEKWPDNGLRHSCASYSLALTGDAVRVAYQLGNSADMIHRHYKALVTAANINFFMGSILSEAIGPCLPFCQSLTTGPPVATVIIRHCSSQERA